MYEALGEAYQVLGNVHESERWLRKAVDVDHAATTQEQSSTALLTYARFLAKNVRTYNDLIIVDLFIYLFISARLVIDHLLPSRSLARFLISNSFAKREAKTYCTTNDRERRGVKEKERHFLVSKSTVLNNWFLLISLGESARRSGATLPTGSTNRSS